MTRLSYRSPKTEVRESKIHGRGLFATADIAKNEIVAVKGGHIIDRKTLRENYTSAEPCGNSDRRRSVHRAGERRRTRVVDAVFKSLMRPESRDAMRDICAGEELTHDWAMTDDDDYCLACNCGAPDCRKNLSGKDWQRPDLQKR